MTQTYYSRDPKDAEETKRWVLYTVEKYTVKDTATLFHDPLSKFYPNCDHEELIWRWINDKKAEDPERWDGLN